VLLCGECYENVHTILKFFLKHFALPLEDTLNAFLLLWQSSMYTNELFDSNLICYENTKYLFYNKHFGANGMR
jgi:hypothetical protein